MMVFEFTAKFLYVVLKCVLNSMVVSNVPCNVFALAKVSPPLERLDQYLIYKFNV